MHAVQIYDTTIVDTDSGLAARWLVIPARASPSLANAGQDSLEILGLRHLFGGSEPTPVSNLPFLIGQVVSSATEAEFAQANRTEVPLWIQTQVLAFGEYLTFADVIPIEHSPLVADSLSRLITTASGAGLGAWVGFAVSGPTPLALVTVPAGTIIGGAAMGVGRALEEGLYFRILKAMGAPTPKTAPKVR